ncbi:retrovirus-related pol polyprotein from transposon TNT 1-94 [Tanacetum coccineum]
MHNNIMAAGSRDHPPILAPGRYAQWKSCLLRYIDTRPNGDALIKCILEGPYQLTTVIIPDVPTTDDSRAIPEQTAVETLLNMSPKNKERYQSEKEAIHLLLTGIGDEIYSTVDACKTAHDMWIAIEMLQQGESLNIQDVKTNLFWEFGRFTSHDGESVESYYSRFYNMMNEMIRNNLTVATMQLFDVLKQHQKEFNEIYVERIAKNANPLALVAAAQQYPDPYYQAPKSHNSFTPPSKQAFSTRSNASTKYKGKERSKPITPQSESTSEEDSDPEQSQRDKDMQKNLALNAKYFKKIYKPTNNNLRTSLNSRNKNVDTSPRYKNDNQIGQFGNQRTVIECRKLKRVKDYTYHKEKILLCKQVKKGVPLQAEQADWLEDTDEETDEQELESHYSYMEKIRKVPNADSGTDNEPLEQIVQLILFIVDSGCTKHMTGNLKLLCNFVEKYLGNITINRVYYVKELNHNLFSVGQFCDAGLEVAFQNSTCFVRDLQGKDLLTGNRESDLYTISFQETASSTPICFMAKASPTQAYRRLSHLNFDYINLLSKKDIVIGLPKLKYVKDKLCSFCEVSKAKRSSFKTKVVPSSKGWLNLLHMDLCDPMGVASINRKKYIMVIVDDYSRYTWTLSLRSKDETPQVLKDFLKMIQRNLQA